MQRKFGIALLAALGGASHAFAETGSLTIDTSFGSVSAALASGAMAVPAASWTTLLAAALFILLATRKRLLRLRSTTPLMTAALLATTVAALHWYGDAQAVGPLHLTPPTLFASSGSQQTLQLDNQTGQPIHIQDIRTQGRFTQTNSCGSLLGSGAHCAITVAYQPGICQTCDSSACINGACQGPTCSDQQRNGTETDVDCGGTCGACGDGKTCSVGTDCQSNVCGAGGVCQPAACNDQVKNGSETDTDCGGVCGACAAGKTCSSGTDCQSNVCGAGVCQPASCTDQVKNGTETDTDCGGTCGACNAGNACLVSADCVSGTCNSGICQ
ncbi:MAG: hypothetical protein LWW96_07190 [Acidovorax sp.]|uniref:hypothetical protein n=1 Tax=Acidovorax sp. TaxID=1872122 RepID=UPI0025C54888|nr:hypothetical protein [Acidovorax sp.]MCE1191919.1 hypothetical protein [Acidovorax sp.]